MDTIILIQVVVLMSILIPILIILLGLLILRSRREVRALQGDVQLLRELIDLNKKASLKKQVQKTPSDNESQKEIDD